MSPLRPTSTSATKQSAVNPLGVMLCALATLVTVPVLLSSGARSDSVEVAAVAVATSAGEDTSASRLDTEVDIDGLFDAGARIDEIPPASVAEPDPDRAATAVVAAANGGSIDAASSEPQAARSADRDAADVQRPAPSSDSGEATETPASPTTAPSTTAPPTTAPPTTAAPTTAAPTTAAPSAPTTTEPPVTETAAPVVEAPQAAPAEEASPAPVGPTPEQWEALRRCEASGNYSIVSANGLYHGAYQFYQPTWDGLARQVGRADLVGLPPSQASPADQDALALLLWQQRGNQPWPHCGRYLPAGP